MKHSSPTLVGFEGHIGSVGKAAITDQISGMVGGASESDQPFLPIEGAGAPLDYVVVGLLFVSASGLNKFLSAFLTEAGKLLAQRIFAPPGEDVARSKRAQTASEAGTVVEIRRHIYIGIDSTDRDPMQRIIEAVAARYIQIPNVASPDELHSAIVEEIRYVLQAYESNVAITQEQGNRSDE